jgi:hypothetical protein
MSDNAGIPVKNFRDLFDTLADLDNNGENFPHEQIRLTAIVPNWRRSVR